MTEKYLYQLNVKLSYLLRDDLLAVSKAQGVKPSELVRNWIREKVVEYKKRRGRPRVEKETEEVTA